MQLRKLILPCAVLLSLWLFYPSREYGLVTDYLGWLNKYKAGSWSDVWHCFNYPGLHQFFHLVNYGIFRLTGADTFQLYLIFSAMHGLTAYAVYRFLRRLGEYWKVEDSGLLAFFAAILFLVSPYSVEAVTWKACFHYLLFTALIAASGHHFTNFVHRGEAKEALLHLVYFIPALFTIELGLVAPGIFALIYLGGYVVRGQQKTLKRGGLLTAVHAALLAVYFILTKWMIGSFVGHYGAEKHLNFDIGILLATFSKYVLKYTAFTHYLPFKTRYDVYEFFSSPWAAAALLVLLAALFVFIWKRYAGDSRRLVLVAGSAAFAVALLPVLNLYFMNLHPYENDRYGYFAAPFFYWACMAAVFILIPKYRLLVTALLLAVHLFFQSKTIDQTRLAGEIITGLVDDFRWYDADRLVVTGLSENHNGCYMFRDFSDEGVALKESLEWKGGRIYSGEIHVLSKFNTMNADAHLETKVTEDGCLEVWDMAPGSWFWRKGVGMGSYQNEKVNVDMKAGYFVACLDSSLIGAVVIQPEGNKWKVISEAWGK